MMAIAKKPLGFGSVAQVSEFFGIPQSEVRTKAKTGEWPSYMIGGRRVFDVDELLSLLATSNVKEDPNQ